VRVAQEAINKPGMKKNINSAHSRSWSALREVASSSVNALKEKNEDNSSKHVYICT
jgi:hypothetical protein